jgi:hypothetical protein
MAEDKFTMDYNDFGHGDSKRAAPGPKVYSKCINFIRKDQLVKYDYEIGKKYGSTVGIKPSKHFECVPGKSKYKPQYIFIVHLFCCQHYKCTKIKKCKTHGESCERWNPREKCIYSILRQSKQSGVPATLKIFFDDVRNYIDYTQGANIETAKEAKRRKDVLNSAVKEFEKLFKATLTGGKNTIQICQQYSCEVHAGP